MKKKYKLLENDTIVIDNTTLYRIEALRDFGDVKKGDKGGYIEKEDNLCHDGDCWVHNNVFVHNNVCIFGDRQIYNNNIEVIAP